jgi:hypothetical protein
VLATFSGKYGDILWSLPTVRELQRKYNRQIDFAVMPHYRQLLPLLRYQSYIRMAFIIDDWTCVGSPCGDQPWQPPKHCEQGYDFVHHLTYRTHPGMNGAPAMQLADFTAWQQGLKLEEPVVPFIAAPMIGLANVSSVCYAFNEMESELKGRFMHRLRATLPASVSLIDVSRMTWLDAASAIQSAGVFVGCRSANWVIAMGLGVETYTYEPNPSRNAFGPWGRVFGSSHGRETTAPLEASPESAADMVVSKLKSMRLQ